MFKYSYPGSQIRGESKVYSLSVSDTVDSVSFVNTSKGFTIANVGTNNAFVSFDNEIATVNKFPIRAGETISFPKLQVDKVSAICISTETADLRILVEY